MRIMKKILSLLLVVTMTMAMGLTALAADGTQADTNVTTKTVTFNIYKDKEELLAGPITVTVDSGTTLDKAVEKLMNYFPNFKFGTYQGEAYRYLESMIINGEAYKSESSTTVNGNHGHYEGSDWEYYVGEKMNDNTYGQVYMSSYVINDNINVFLNFAYSSFDW
ncbi:hypothetical protein SAMN05216249_1392 [Acetitomaculum ruminis DSM 5522]|uniref:DUF4430 domain-containing protein n=1 Tax=Acetitomaculum ruminis DSM 5522 TaxID=1120918 RepID=A0A1I1AQJ1_9FIRM|nr:hypothetical protein [Acetitomaculum ruminis]SFB40305.1 hypothetical protein SAMN05216249_1392 [Acetitomaculum ruminis DSM 5522]